MTWAATRYYSTFLSPSAENQKEPLTLILHRVWFSPIEDDGGANVECYNQHLKELDGTDDSWFTAAWLFAECYLQVPKRLAPLP